MPWTNAHDHEAIPFSKDELTKAIRLLGHNKAAGLDQMNDHHIRLVSNLPEVFHKLLTTFNDWWLHQTIP